METLIRWNIVGIISLSRESKRMTHEAGNNKNR